MERFNGSRWRDHVSEHIHPRIEQFGNVSSSRIWPVFDTIDQEATDMEKRRRSELLAEADGPEGYLVDGGEAVSDLAYWEASDFPEMLSAMKWATMGLFSTGLYHLTEQYLVELPLAILRFHQGNDLQWKRSVQPNAAIAWFKEELGLDV